MAISSLLEERVKIPDGVRASKEGDLIVVSGKGGSLRRSLGAGRVTVDVDGGEVRISSAFAGKREKALVGTYAAHLRNMIRGVTEGFTYEMKIVYSHFPVKASLKGEDFVIENFLGEKHPRHARVLGDTKVEVSGDRVVLRGPDIEAVSQTAANIELATRIRGFDPRIFQDGIYITKKAGES